MQVATLVERPGGHHFDGNYAPIAEQILSRLYAGAVRFGTLTSCVVAWESEFATI
jgi:hypothetical protein